MGIGVRSGSQPGPDREGLTKVQQAESERQTTDLGHSGACELACVNLGTAVLLGSCPEQRTEFSGIPGLRSLDAGSPSPLSRE